MVSENVLGDKEFETFYGNFYAEGGGVVFDLNLVPRNLRELVCYAEFWGVTDDRARQDLVLKAPDEVQRNLKKVVEDYDDEFDDWLAGPEAHTPTPSDAYLAYSAMRMAADFV